MARLISERKALRWITMEFDEAELKFLLRLAERSWYDLPDEARGLIPHEHHRRLIKELRDVCQK